VHRGDRRIGSSAITAGLPFRVLTRGLETVIEEAATGRPVAWFPYALKHIATHPSGLLWAGAAGSHLYLLRLEGAGNAKKSSTANDE